MDKEKEILIDWRRLVDDTEKSLLNTEDDNKMVYLLQAIKKNKDVLETEEEIQHYLQRGEDTILDLQTLKELLVKQTDKAISAYKDISQNDKLSEAGKEDMKKLVDLIAQHTILGNNLMEKDLNAEEFYDLIIEAETLKLLNDLLLKISKEDEEDEE